VAALELILVLLAASAALQLAAERLAVPHPVLLVLGGAILAAIPGLPRPHLDPEIVFLEDVIADAVMRRIQRDLDLEQLLLESPEAMRDTVGMASETEEAEEAEDAEDAEGSERGSAR